MILQERIYIIGPHGGKGGTVKVDNFTDHLPAIFDMPDADPPIPYTELLFTAVPGYKHRKPAVSREDLPSLIAGDHGARLEGST